MNSSEKNTASCDVETGVCSAEHADVKSEQEEGSIEKSEKVKLTYYFDALCGWCYGFSPVVAELVDIYGDKLEIEVISGGLFLGDRAGKVNAVAPHIKAGAYKSVEMSTGVKFGAPFLEDVFGEGELTLNSLPPSIALCIIKEKFPEKEVEFASLLLSAVYSDGLNTIDIDGYAPYAEKIGFDTTEFLAKMRDEKYQEAAENEFKKFSSSPLSAMPSLVILTEDGPRSIARGYTSIEQLKARIAPYLN